MTLLPPAPASAPPSATVTLVMPAGSMAEICSWMTPEKITPAVGVISASSGTVAPTWHLPSAAQ